MERNAFINGRNIWSTWGAELMDGALEAILTPPPVKDYIENDSRLEHGIQITSSPEICKMDSRELTLPFFITGNSQSDYLDKYSSFVCVTKSFQISKDYTGLYVKRGGQVPGRFLSGRLRGIFEDFVFPFPVVGVKLKLIVVCPGFTVVLGFVQIA